LLVTPLRYSPTVLHLHTADWIGPLADELAAVLSDPLDDPMAPEWIAVASNGMERWLRLRLARSLGAGPSGSDGIAANLEMAFPGSLRGAVLKADRPEGDGDDPWTVDRLVWAMLDVLHANQANAALGAVTNVPVGATAFGRARRLADLFERYGVHRPEMLRAWAGNDDVDGAGNRLGPDVMWQPTLWRLVRDRIGEPSPAERLPDVFARVAAGDIELDLPPRLSVFGLTTLPGGTPFLELLTAAAAQRDVHLFLHCPSPGLVELVQVAVGQAAGAGTGPAVISRADDPASDLVCHPLLRSWAKPNREAITLLAAAGITPEPAGALGSDLTGTTSPAAAVAASDATSLVTNPPPNLLRRLHHDLQLGIPPIGDFVPTVDDRSIQIHSCHGPGRQVEVLRDALLHLLADDPTLREDDIVVLCPAIDTFAQLVNAGFGTSVDSNHEADHDALGPPRLRYRVTDRSLRSTYPTLAALDALVELIGSRFTASATMDFIAQPAVRLRYGFDDDDLSDLLKWVDTCEVKWGLDGEHRAGWGISADFIAGTWRTALDRLLVGVTSSIDDTAFAVGGILPVAVEGGRIEVVGRLADLLTRLADLADLARHPRPVGEWCRLLDQAADDLLDAPSDAAWQMTRVHDLFREIETAAHAGDEPSTIELTLADVRRMLGDQLAGSPRRPDFFRGGITVSSLTPLRGIPFRVVCLLGMDDTAFGAGGADGDDLIAAAPHLGDRDNRADTRLALLETVLAARERLLITRTGHNVVTNLTVPACTPLAELTDAVLATIDPDNRDRVRQQLTVVHPRQPFDERNFVPGALVPDTTWGFDSGAQSGAVARLGDRPEPGAFISARLEPGPSDVIELAEIKSVLRDPVKAFLTRSLNLALPKEVEADLADDDLPTTLNGLDRWKVAERLLEARLNGQSEDQWEARERARGSLPAGLLGDQIVTDVGTVIEDLVAAADTIGSTDLAPTPRSIDVTLPDGTRIVGSVPDHHGHRPGPAQVTFSRFAPKHRLAAWLDLVALVAFDPVTDWQSVTIGRSKKDGAAVHVEHLLPVGATADERQVVATDALAVAVDCYRRALAEPIPLFAELSPELAEGSAKPGSWKRDYGRQGDGYEQATQLAFGDLSYRELLAIPASDDDPPGDAAGRAQRYAEFLWGAIDRSVAQPDPTEPTDSADVDAATDTPTDGSGGGDD
jgi:exodeoxyribonuclease V gamma subunit